jgi:uncharacterized membrane protein
MPNGHPLIVHFPIALLSLALVFEVLARFVRPEEFSRLGWWLQVTGTVGLALAVTSGLFVKDTVTIPPLARPFLESHQEMAFAASGLFALLLLWRIASKTRVPQKYALLFLVLFAAGVTVMWAGAWYGGEMVFRFGVGLKTVRGLL